MTHRTKRKGTRGAHDTGGAYSRFKRFMVEEGSKLGSKHFPTSLSKRKTGKTRRTLGESFREFFTAAHAKIRKDANARERYLAELFIPFVEVDLSLESLRSVPVYLDRFPKSKSFSQAGITKSKYISYHIQNYLQEVYILKERMSRLVTPLSKWCMRSGQHEMGVSLSQSLKLFQNELRSRTDMRRTHVHFRSFSDENLMTLTMLDSVKEDHPALQRAHDVMVVLEKRRWLEWIRRSNQLIVSGVDKVFEAVNQCVFRQ